MSTIERRDQTTTCDRDHAAIRKFKSSPEYSHATTRREMQNSILIYAHHPTSPTGVHLYHGLTGNRNCYECMSIFWPYVPRRSEGAVSRTYLDDPKVRS